MTLNQGVRGRWFFVQKWDIPLDGKADGKCRKAIQKEK